MLKNYLLKRKIRKFLTVMPRTLTHDYGRAAEYTEGQVKVALKKLGYDDKELENIAIAIYCNNETAVAFGIDEALVKKYRGYPEEHRISIGYGTGVGGFDGGSSE